MKIFSTFIVISAMVIMTVTYATAAPLIDAISNGDIETVQTLVKKGVNVNAKDDTGSTALHEACYRGYVDIVRLLIDRGRIYRSRIISG